MFRNRHRRTQSDHSGPFSLTIPHPHSQKSPESRLSGRFVASPLSSCQADISHPLAVEDPEKLEHFSRQKLTTMQRMYEQAKRECEELKQEFQKKPTEMVHANLEAKVKVFRRLESQLSMYGGENDAPSGEKRICQRESSIESSLPVSDGDRDVSTRPPPTPSYAPKSKGNDSGAAKTDKAKQEVQLTRSHSDGYKGTEKGTGGDRLRFAASVSEFGKFAIAASDDFDIESHLDDDSFGQSKSQDSASNESSDSVLNRLHPNSDLPSLTPSVISDAFDGSKQQQSHIIAIDDYEFNGSDDENSNQSKDFGSPFNDFSVLKNRPAHLAVFLRYLISNSDSSPVLFYLMSGQNYSTGPFKELRKWAYEIFSTFLADKAPLKVKVDESYVEAINDILLNKFEKEDLMRSLFVSVRERFAIPQITELLSDYQSKRALGLGAMFGESELRGLDHNSELKVVENVLWKDFEQAVDSDCEQKQVFASALATYFKQIGCTSVRNVHLLDRCSTFNAKDKSRFSVFSKGPRKERVFNHRSHSLLPQHYYALTNCNFCHSVLFGVGSQGYQCQKCDQNFHKGCLEKIKDPCSGKKSKPPNVFDKFISKKPISVEEPVEDDLGHKDSSMKGAEKSDPLKSVDEAKPFISPPETISSDVVPDEEHQTDAAEITKSPPPSYTSSLVFNVPPYSVVPPDGPPSYMSLQISGDSELDVEQDLPPLEAIIPKEHLKKLDKKEKKRQEVINELFYTEKTHMRDVKIMKMLFYLPMSQEPSLAELADFVFPHINEIVEFHSNLSSEFQQIRNASSHYIVGDFAETLVTNFSGEKGENFKMVCGQFCERQSQAQEQLKAQQRKEPKLVSILQTAASNPLCRRLTWKDFLPMPMQRLTKYPLLIENLMKHTPVESEEYSRLQAALNCSREILLFVNKTVSEYQNRLKLTEIEKKLDNRQIENSLDPLLKEYKNLNLSEHVLLHDGLLLWRIRRDRVIPVHVVLLDSILLLLQKQDDRLVLRCEHMQIAAAGRDDRKKLTYSPVIKLANVLVRPVATDKCAFFLINVSSGSSPQIYDLIASSKEEKNKWCKYINNAAETTIVRQKGFNCTVSHVTHIPVHQMHHAAEPETADSSQVIPDVDRRHEGLHGAYDEDEDVTDESDEQHTASQKNEDETSGALSSDASIVDSSTGQNICVDPIEQLAQIDDAIRHKMCERMKIWSQLWHESDPDDDRSELRKNPGIRKHLFQTLLETDQMMCLVNNQCTVTGSESAAVCSPSLLESSQSETDKTLHDGNETASVMEGFQTGSHVSFPISQILDLSNSIHRHLMHLLESVIRTDEEKRKLLLDLRLAQEKLAFLDLSDSHAQQTKYSSNQKLSEMIDDFVERKCLPVSSDSDLLNSSPVIDDTSSDDRFDSKVKADDVSTYEKCDTVTDISVVLASDVPDNATSTDA